MIQKIQDALKKLDVNNGNHWTADGLPRLDTVKMLAADQSITREFIASVAPGFSRQNPTFSQTPDSVFDVKSVATVGNPESVINSVQEVVETVATVVQTVAEAITETVNDIATILKEQTAKVEQLRQQKFKLDALFEEERRKEDSIREQYERTLGKADTNNSAIQEYLASQQRQLLERAAKKKLIRESGIDLKELQQGLRSPLDSAMSRKTSRGSQRPGS